MHARAARLGGTLLAVAWLSSSAFAQTQVLGAGETVVITATTPVVIDTVAVDVAGTRDIGLAAHFYVEGSGFDANGYEFRLERVTPSAAVVGTVNWAPAAALNASPVGDTVAITGFDDSVPTPALYRLVGQKISAAAANLSVTARGIDAIERNAGTIVAGSRAAGSVAVTASTFTPIHTLDVTVPFPADVLLWGHVTLSKPSGGDDGGYGIGICDELGTSISTDTWFPGAQTPETNVLSVVALDAGVPNDTSYSICAIRVGDAPSATATFRSLQAVRALSLEGSAGGPGAAAPVASTAYAAIWILDVANTDPEGMAVLVQASPFAASSANLLYEFGIHRGSCAGPRIGAAGWRPGEGPVGADASDTLFVTGFDAAPDEPQTYAFCGRKTNAAAADLNFYGMRMATAPLPVPEPTGAAVTIVGIAALGARTRSRRHINRA